MRSTSICGGVAGPDENKNEEDTEGNDETESPEGLDGDGSELWGEAGRELVRSVMSGGVIVKLKGTPRSVPTLELVSGSSSMAKAQVWGSCECEKVMIFKK